MNNLLCAPLSNFPTEPKNKRLEFVVDAKVNSSSSSFLEISNHIRNLTAYPARATETLEAHYYINLKNDLQNGISVNDISVTSNNLQGTMVDSELYPYDEENGIYYAKLTVLPSSNNGILRPGGQSEHRREFQFRITFPNGYSSHDFTQDWSYQGIGENSDGIGGRSVIHQLTVYENGNLVSGTEPDGTTPDVTVGKIIVDSDQSLIINNPLLEQNLNLSKPYYNKDSDADISVEILNLPQGSTIKLNNMPISLSSVLMASDLPNLVISYASNINLTNDSFSYKAKLLSDETTFSEHSLLIQVENALPVVDGNKTIKINENDVGTNINLNINKPTDPNNDDLTVVVTEVPDNGDIYLESSVLTQGHSLTPEELTNLSIVVLENTTIGLLGNFSYNVSDSRGGEVSQMISFELIEQPVETCNAIFEIDNQWDGGFVLNVKIQNNTPNTISNWQAVLNPVNFSVNNIWNAKVNQFNNNTLTIDAENYNSNIAANAQVEFGLQGSGSFTQPTSFIVNNIHCTIDGENNSNDTTPPQTPQVSVSDIDDNSAILTWQAVNDDQTSSENILYEIYLNNQLQASVNQTEYSLSGLSAETNYSVFIKAVDESNNKSNNSNSVNFTTLEDNNTGNSICQANLSGNVWNSGATLHLNLNNISNESLNDWQITFTLPNGVSLNGSGWGGNFVQNGNIVTITAKDYNSSIAANSEFGHIGINLNHSGEISDINDLVSNSNIKVNNDNCSN